MTAGAEGARRRAGHAEETMRARIGILAAVAVLSMCAVLPARPTDGKESGAPRFPQLTVEQLDDQQRPLGEKIMKISSVGLGGPYNAMLRSPAMAQRLYDLLDYLRWHTSVPTRLNEFAILIEARLWRSQVEWYAHYPLALKAGLAESVAADLKANRRPHAMQPDEAIVYDFCMELAQHHAVSDETFDRARTLLGEQGVVDLTAVSGTYVTVAMLLSAAEAGVPPGKEPPFATGEP
jgi:4-carboxymuconolactone decarboxylase